VDVDSFQILLIDHVIDVVRAVEDVLLLSVRENRLPFFLVLILLREGLQRGMNNNLNAAFISQCVSVISGAGPTLILYLMVRHKIEHGNSTCPLNFLEIVVLSGAASEEDARVADLVDSELVPEVAVHFDQVTLDHEVVRIAPFVVRAGVFHLEHTAWAPLPYFLPSCMILNAILILDAIQLSVIIFHSDCKFKLHLLLSSLWD
jgi:hypothetical protein